MRLEQLREGDGHGDLRRIIPSSRLHQGYPDTRILAETRCEHASGRAGPDDDDLRAFSGSYSQTGFFGVNSLYMNDADNRDYFDSVDGKLKLPVLFLSGSNDFVCDTEHSDLAKPMRAACSDLTFSTIASGHWMTHERPAAVTAAICRWIADKVPSFWPS